MSYNLTINNRNFDENTVQAVWNKGIIIPGRDPNYCRKDVCGALMLRSHYGNTSFSTGWEIDHIIPKSKGGPDSLSNLQPLQWENNRHKGDSYPNYTCKIKAA